MCWRIWHWKVLLNVKYSLITYNNLLIKYFVKALLIYTYVLSSTMDCYPSTIYSAKCRIIAARKYSSLKSSSTLIHAASDRRFWAFQKNQMKGPWGNIFFEVPTFPQKELPPFINNKKKLYVLILSLETRRNYYYYFVLFCFSFFCFLFFFLSFFSFFSLSFYRDDINTRITHLISNGERGRWTRKI